MASILLFSPYHKHWKSKHPFQELAHSFLIKIFPLCDHTLLVDIFSLTKVFFYLSTSQLIVSTVITVWLVPECLLLSGYRAYIAFVTKIDACTNHILLNLLNRHRADENCTVEVVTILNMAAATMYIK